jgi:hypothetical protein
MSKPLSPVAQAVLDAANGRSSYGPEDCLNEARQIAAAALRAAADHLYTLSPWAGHIESAGTSWAIDELRAIATELEAAA